MEKAIEKYEADREARDAEEEEMGDAEKILRMRANTLRDQVMLQRTDSIKNLQPLRQFKKEEKEARKGKVISFPHNFLCFTRFFLCCGFPYISHSIGLTHNCRCTKIRSTGKMWKRTGNFGK